MTQAVLPTHQLGWIPNLMMWEGTLAFRVNAEKSDALLVGKAASAGIRQAIEATMNTFHEVQTLAKDYTMEAAQMRQLERRLEEVIRAIAETNKSARESGSAIVMDLDEAERSAQEALSYVSSLFHRKDPAVAARNKEGGAKHHIADATQAIRLRKMHFGWVLKYAQAAAGNLTAAIKTLEAGRIGLVLEPRPFGPVLFDAVTGEFRYDRHEQDRTPFVATFSARFNDEMESQAITIAPIPLLPAKAEEIIDQAILRYVVDTQIENRYVPEDDNKKLFLTGLELTLEQKDLNGSFENIIVRGHIVRIPDSLKAANGRTNLDIAARYVVFGSGASIDVSGKKGEESIRTDEPKDAKTAKPAGIDKKAADDSKVSHEGEKGADGKDGRAGQNGGTIKIVAEQVIGVPTLIANGGPGERGEDGGDGHPGGRGDPGKNDVTEKLHGLKGGGSATGVKEEGTPGFQGKQGGKGGKAGRRGKHGDAGLIYLSTVLPCVAGDFQAHPGQNFVTITADSEAKAGKGGAGGPGGFGGIKYAPVTLKTVRYDGGPPGLSGGKGDDALPAEPGLLHEPQKTSIGYAEICSALVPEKDYASYGVQATALLSMVLFAAERLYLNAQSEKDMETLRDVIAYMLRVTANPAAAIESRVRTTHERCSTLKVNLAHGLDYFGKTHDFVYSLSLETNEDFYTKFRDVAKDLEADYNKFWNKDETLAEKRKALRSQINRAKNLVTQELGPKAKDTEFEAREDAKSIDLLTDKVITQKAEVMKKIVEFQDQLHEKQAFEHLVGFIKIAYSFVIAGSNLKPMLSNGKALLEDIFKGEAPGGEKAAKGKGKKEENDKDEKKKEKEDPKKEHKDLAVAAFGEVKGGIISIAENYSKYFQDDEPNDLVKLALEEQDRESFDKEIDRFLDVAKAGELKTEVHKYLDLVTQRNKLVLERDAAVLKAHDLREQIATIEKENADLENKAIGEYDPGLPVFVKYMFRTTQLLKSFIIETLCMMSRSADYYTLESKPPGLVDYTVSSLEGQYAEILKRLQDAGETAGPPSTITCTLIIDDQAQLEKFRQYKPVWFSIPLNTDRRRSGPFAVFDRPLISKIECYLDGLTSPHKQAKAVVAIQHSGVSYCYNETSGTIWSFAHAPRTILFQYNVEARDHSDRSGDVTGGGAHIMLSPFSLWNVQFIRDENETFDDFSKIKRLEVIFTTTGKANPSTGKAVQGEERAHSL